MLLNNENDTPVNSRKNLKVTKCKSMHDLVKQLVAEGMELLDQEEKQKNMGLVHDKKQKTKTKDAYDKFFDTSPENPYQIAREQILSKMEEYKRNEILEMESTGNTDNRFYQDFVNEIVKLGNTL